MWFSGLNLNDRPLVTLSQGVHTRQPLSKLCFSWKVIVLVEMWNTVCVWTTGLVSRFSILVIQGSFHSVQNASMEIPRPSADICHRLLWIDSVVTWQQDVVSLSLRAFGEDAKQCVLKDEFTWNRVSFLILKLCTFKHIEWSYNKTVDFGDAKRLAYVSRTVCICVVCIMVWRGQILIVVTVFWYTDLARWCSNAFLHFNSSGCPLTQDCDPSVSSLALHSFWLLVSWSSSRLMSLDLSRSLRILCQFSCSKPWPSCC